jgi:hypothetical protein
MRIRSVTRVVGILGSALLVGACSGSAATGSPGTLGPSEPTLSQAPTANQATASVEPSVEVTAGLVLLGGEGRPLLWTYASKTGWESTTADSGAEAIAAIDEGVLVAGKKTAEVRPAADVARTSESLTLQWPSTLERAAISSASVSPSGKLAFAVSAEGSVTYATASPSGVVSVEYTPPSQPFTPLVAWIDDDRRLVLTMTAGQQSRLAVTTGESALTELTAVDGCRWFAVSGDGGTVAVATDGIIFVGPTASWLSNAAPRQLASVAGGQIVWDLALDRTGRRLALLSGAVGGDGTVAAVHETVYELSDGSWHMRVDVAVPFADALGQAWAG